jgi:acetylglutamate kinase
MDWETEKQMFKITKNLLDFSRSVLYNIILNRNNGEELEPSNIVHIKKEIDMTATTVTNYTPEMTAELVTRYLAGETVETLAAFAGKTTRSIVAKLSREGVYVAKTKTKAEVRVKKAELVAQLAARLGVDEDSVGDLEKLTAKTLGLLLDAV